MHTDDKTSCSWCTVAVRPGTPGTLSGPAGVLCPGCAAEYRSRLDEAAAEARA